MPRYLASDGRWYPVEQPRNGMATASLVLGIVGIVCGLIPLTFLIAWGCGAVGLRSGR